MGRGAKGEEGAKGGGGRHARKGKLVYKEMWQG